MHWELEPEQRLDRFLPLPCKPVWWLPVVRSDRMNTLPTSPNQANTRVWGSHLRNDLTGLMRSIGRSNLVGHAGNGLIQTTLSDS